MTQKWYREHNKEKAIQYLGGVCTSCGEANSNLLEFDHINFRTKSFSIGWNLQRTWEYLLPELSKCQLLCTVCHAIKTSKERNPPCGTRSKYNRGCHCEECRTANAKYEYNRRHGL